MYKIPSKWSISCCNTIAKKLSAKKREELYALLEQEARNNRLSYGIGEASAAEIDRLNILQATFLAMRRALEKLPRRPDIAIIDGNRNPKDFPCPSTTVIKGDAKSYSVAAASIMAKVYRDRFMSSLAQIYPGYGFEKRTYEPVFGTPDHGLCPGHKPRVPALDQFDVTMPSRLGFHGAYFRPEPYLFRKNTLDTLLQTGLKFEKVNVVFLHSRGKVPYLYKINKFYFKEMIFYVK